MKIQAITFDKAQLGWNIKAEISVETHRPFTYRQFTSEWHVFDNSTCKNSRSIIISIIRIYFYIKSEIKVLECIPGKFSFR